jgi:hypothetical protein
MSFFQIPPEEETPERDQPAWRAAPVDELGVELPLDRALAESETARVTIRSVIAFSTGFSLELLGEWAPGALGVSGHRFVTPHEEAFLRVGIEFPDGARATNVDFARRRKERDDAPPEPPYLGRGHAQHLSDHRLRFDLDYWIWPLPPDADISVVCEWPAVGIPVTRSALDGASIRAAGKRSGKLW